MLKHFVVGFFEFPFEGGPIEAGKFGLVHELRDFSDFGQLWLAIAR